MFNGLSGKAAGAYEGSAAECVAAGRVSFPGGEGESIFVRFYNMLVQEGKLLVTGGQDAVTQITEVTKDCSTSIETLEFDQYIFPDFEMAPDACQGSRRNAVVLLGLYHSFNYYHFVVDTLFQVYVIVGHLAQELGCPSEGIETYYIARENQGKNTVDRRYWPVMEAVFGPVNEVKTANGCFNTMLYGIMHQRFLPCLNRLFWYGPRYSSWWHAFQRDVREQLLRKVASSDLSGSTSEAMLVIQHRRMPLWLQEMKWDGQHFRPDPPETKVVYVDIASKPLSAQIGMLLRARGLISLQGASLVNQVYLPQLSAVLEVVVAQDYIDENFRLNFSGDACYNSPTTCHDLMGLHLGHSVLVWKWCDHQGFPEKVAQEVLSHLLEANQRMRSTSHGWSCYLCNLDHTSRMDLASSSLQCDHEITVAWPPVPHGLSCPGVRQCGPLMAGPTLLAETFYRPVPEQLGNEGPCMLCKGGKETFDKGDDWFGDPETPICPRQWDWSRPKLVWDEPPSI